MSSRIRCPSFRILSGGTGWDSKVINFVGGIESLGLRLEMKFLGESGIEGSAFESTSKTSVIIGTSTTSNCEAEFVLLFCNPLLT
jgi:hypothetical protein